jgi:hypothetical protein
MEAEWGQAPDWMTKGKTIAGLIEELRTFSDQNLEVRISTDDGGTPTQSAWSASKTALAS